MSPIGAAADGRFRLLPAGLPDLAGPFLAAYRILWLAALAGALIVQALAVIHAQQAPALRALGLAQAAVLVAVAALLFRRRPRDPIAAMLSLAFLIWAITGGAEVEAAGRLRPWLEGLDRARFLLLVAALMLFPTGRFEPRWTAPALAVTGIVFLVGIAGALGLVPESLFLPPAVLCVLSAVAALIVRLRRLEPTSQRQQLKWVALGLAAGLAFILVHRVGIALVPTDRAGHPGIGLLLESSLRAGIMLMALGFLVSLLGYRLYDADAAISRSAAYLALTVSLVAIFAASEAMIQLLGQRYLGMRGGDFSAAMAAAVAAALIVPLHERMTRWTERRFQRGLAALREELPALLMDVDEHDDCVELAALVLPRLEAGLRSTRIALAIDGTVVAVNDMAETEAQAWLDGWMPPACPGPLDGDAGDPLFPLRMPLTGSTGNHFGWLLLGPRPDGSFYREDELEALAAVAPLLRRAVLAVRSRELWQARLELLTARVAVLEKCGSVAAEAARAG